MGLDRHRCWALSGSFNKPTAFKRPSHQVIQEGPILVKQAAQVTLELSPGRLQSDRSPINLHILLPGFREDRTLSLHPKI